MAVPGRAADAVQATADPSDSMPPAAEVAPRQFTGWLLRRAFVACRDEAEASVANDANLREVPALTVLTSAPSLSQARLADRLDLSATATGKIIEALEARGFVRRVRSEQDRRSNEVSLTAAGSERLGRLRGELDEAEARVTRALDASERSALVALLQRLLADDAPATIVGLSTSVGFLVSRAHKVMMQRAERLLAPLRISPREFGVLATLGRNQPCSQQRLADLMGVSAPAILSVIDELEGAGLVDRRRNTADRRVYDLALTERGGEVLSEARRVAEHLQAMLAETMGRTEDEQLRGLLEKIAAQPVDPVPLRSST